MMDISVFSAPLREILAKFWSSAGDGTRTRTPDYRAADFKSAASAIPPLRLFATVYQIAPFVAMPSRALGIGYHC